MTNSYRWVMWTYPADYRNANGQEIVATAAELTDGAWSVRQWRSLFTNGLRTRSKRATGGSARNAWAQAIVTAIGITAILTAALQVAIRLGFGGGPYLLNAAPTLRLTVDLVTVTILVFGIRRWTAGLVSALTVCGSFAADPTILAPTVAGAVLLSVALGWVAWRLPGTRAFPPIVGVGLLAIAVGAAVLTDSPGAEWISYLLAAAVVLGLLGLTIDARLLMTVTVVWLTVALFNVLLAFDDLITNPSRSDALWIAPQIAMAGVAIGLCAIGGRRLNRPV